VEALTALRTRIQALEALDPGPAPGAAVSEPAAEPEVPSAAAEAPDLAAVAARAEGVAAAVQAAVGKVDALRDERDALPRHIASLRRLLPLLPEFVELRSYATIVLLVERRHEGLLDLLRTHLERTAGSCFEIVSAPLDADTVGAVVIVPRSRAADTDAWLGGERVSQVRVPAPFAGMSVQQAVEAMEARLARLDAEISGAEAGLHAMLGPYRAEWTRALGAIDRLLALHAAVGRAGAVGHAFVVAGWTPSNRVGALRSALAREVGSDVLVQEVPLSREERDSVPLLLRNVAPARPFEFLVRLLGLPRYGTTDPTPLMAIFLPLFFGMMLGDIVYAVVVAALALYVRHRWGRRSPVVRDLATIVLIGSAWALVWGVIFGEAAGNLGRQWLGLRPVWINREEALTALLLFAVAIGVAHVLLGLVIGVATSVRTRDRRLLGERGGMLLALCGLFLLAAVVADRLPSAALTPAIAALAVGVVLVMVAGGATGALLGPVEVMGAIGNVLSYIRLAAIGLASAFLARVANELGGIAGPIWMGVLIAALFHALNVALGIFSPTIQALRLHYVEFFGKFYEAGGRAFEPFGAREGAEAPQAAPAP
jgi:V/A-type H+-transporting ATPase subunit I